MADVMAHLHRANRPSWREMRRRGVKLLMYARGDAQWRNEGTIEA